MCCGDERGYVEPAGSCEECGSEIGHEGDSTQICAYSSTWCGTCEWAPCDGAC